MRHDVRPPYVDSDTMSEYILPPEVHPDTVSGYTLPPDVYLDAVSEQTSPPEVCSDKVFEYDLQPARALFGHNVHIDFVAINAFGPDVRIYVAARKMLDMVAPAPQEVDSDMMSG
mgnify:CR=1 FL=1